MSPACYDIGCKRHPHANKRPAYANSTVCCMKACCGVNKACLRACLCRLLRRENIQVCAVPDVAAAVKQNSVKALQRGARQCTNEVLMIAPTAFGFNDQTAQDNSFMHASREGGSTEAGSDVTQHVLREFSGLYRELTEAGAASYRLHPCTRLLLA